MADAAGLISNVESVPGDEAPPTTEPFAGSTGAGVWVNVITSGGIGLRQRKQINELIADPDILGTQMSLAWKLIEPQPGVIDFALIDKLAGPWWDAGKKVVLEVVWKNRGKDSRVIGVPTWAESEPWVYDATSSDPRAGIFKAPIPWHPGYQAAWYSFMSRLAERYDGHAGIEMVMFGGPQPNSEPGGFEGEMTPPPGFTPQLYASSVLWNMVMVDRAWTDTKKAAQIKFYQPETDFMMKFVERRDWIAVSNGFGQKALAANFLEVWASRRERWPLAEWGYLEYGPAGVGLSTQQSLFEAAAQAGISYVPVELDRYFGTDLDRAESRAANLWAKQNLPNWKRR